MNKSNTIWAGSNNYDDWELRRYRFTDEMRSVYFHYLRIDPDSYVLDGGCGTGVFTRYIAKGLRRGKIVGFDISPSVVSYGNVKIKDEGLSEIARLVVEDGFKLSFDADSFDAVTDYTYLGVLSDPVAGLKELIRVCKPGGAVSTVVATTKIPPVHWKGDYPFEWNDRLDELYGRQDSIFKNEINTASRLLQSDEWHPLRYPRMFAECGLRDISIYPVAHGFSYDDHQWSLDFRKQLVDTGLKREIDWVTDRSRMPEFKQYGFTEKDFDELLGLLKAKRQYLMENIGSDNCWEWTAGLGFVVVGLKSWYKM